MKKKYEWVYCVRQASTSIRQQRWKTRWMWNYMKAKVFKKKRITQHSRKQHTLNLKTMKLRSDLMPKHFGKYAVWMYNVDMKTICSLPIILCTLVPARVSVVSVYRSHQPKRGESIVRFDDFAVLQFALKEIKKYNCSINFKIMAYVRRFSLSHALQSRIIPWIDRGECIHGALFMLLSFLSAIVIMSRSIDLNSSNYWTIKNGARKCTDAETCDWLQTQQTELIKPLAMANKKFIKSDELDMRTNLKCCFFHLHQANTVGILLAQDLMGKMVLTLRRMLHRQFPFTE